MMKRAACVVLVLAMLCFGAVCSAQGFDAQMAQDWLAELALSLPSMKSSNDPAMTADPARAGQTLYAYEFGTVLSDGTPDQADHLLEIELRGTQMADCRGVCVGMGIGDVLDGIYPGESTTSLYVLGTQESGIGWSWAYLGENGVYGVEYVSYGGTDEQMREYTLTYVISPEGTISAIRLRTAEATQMQAEQGLSTALEIAGRQTGVVFAGANAQTALEAGEMSIMGRRALYAPVADLIATLSEPDEIQALPDGHGRILVYDSMVAELAFREATGEEVVVSVTTNASGIEGPRRLTVGMSVQEAAGLFRCDNDVSGTGGILYLEGEAAGEPPYGELVRDASGGAVLRYICAAEDRKTALLEIGIQEETVAYWHMSMQPEKAER